MKQFICVLVVKKQHFRNMCFVKKVEKKSIPMKTSDIYM
jgi:hypothetical protein